MDQRRILKGWQMGVIVGLLALILSTAFMPAFHYNGHVRAKMQSYIMKSIKDGMGFFGDFIKDTEMSEEDIEKVDEDLKDFEEENGVNLHSFSVMRIMTHSLQNLFTDDTKDKDDIDESIGEKLFDTLTHTYNTMRAGLIMLYIMGIIVLIMVIVSFAVKWPKLVPLIMTCVYAVMGTIIFGFMRFGMFKTLSTSTFDMIEDAINDEFSVDLGKLSFGDAFIKLFDYLYSFAFVTAFILCLVLLVFGIACFFVGNKEAVLAGGSKASDNPFGSDMGSASGNPFGGAPVASDNPFGGNAGAGSQTPVKTPAPEPVSPPPAAFDPVSVTVPSPDAMAKAPATPVAPSPKPVAPAVTENVGTVVCSKGLLKGQGFKLPPDRKIVVGKNPGKTNLTINSARISNIHCSIRYDASRRIYIVKDHSSNGTFINEKRLPKGEAVECRPGTVLKLADGENELTLY